MALQFKKNDTQQALQSVETEEIKEYNIVEQRQEMTERLVNSKEIDDIVSGIDVYQPQQLVSFGAEAAEGISKCSDQILNSVNMNQINDSGELLKTLGKIMDKFDLEEISAEPKKGVLGKLFGGAKKQLDQVLSKYHTMGDEVDKIYIKLKEYENEIQSSNQKLEQMFQTNVEYYQSLVKYILAGEQGIKEIDQYLEQMRGEYEKTQDAVLQMDIVGLEQARDVLDQRVMDLRIAENVAMQSVPMIKTMQFSNLNLIRKINSAFIITLPVFKQALTQAVLLKRQKIQAEAMAALDERTNEMLLKNAQNTANQSKLTTQLATGSSVKIETLEKSWQTIVNGIEETQKIQQEAQQKRQQDIERLNQLKIDFNNKMHTNL